jgi:elongation factor Ts
MAEINATQVKSLRQRTGAGIMDCKAALTESNGDEEAAVEWIKKKGLAKVAKKAGAIAADGAIHAYIHAGSRLGVLAEINCQTDFVARSDEFKAFAETVGMQIASMGAQYVRRTEVPAADIAKQRDTFKAQMDEEAATSGKKRPDDVVAKILEGKVDKWLTEVCLEEQPSITDGERTIKLICDELSAKIGEKITVRRFVRFELGEGIEKKTSDLAADVAEALAGA